jgi:hypothetical protein
MAELVTLRPGLGSILALLLLTVVAAVGFAFIARARDLAHAARQAEHSSAEWETLLPVRGRWLRYLGAGLSVLVGTLLLAPIVILVLAWVLNPGGALLF